MLYAENDAVKARSESVVDGKNVKQPQMAADKRQDIQGLRAVAIVAVLLFHVWPTFFPNGYLGVDMFFVLSGYLMAAVLSRVSEVNRSNIVQFYYRRVKRIVPLCLVVLNATVAFALWRFWRLVSSFHVKFIRDMMPSYFFATNVANILEDEDYFELTDQYRFFKHCWSLGVEMQFYLVIPFVFLGIRNLRRPVVVSVCLIIIALSMYTQLISSPIVAFNFTWCRIWQLMSGVSAHLFFAEQKPVKVYERLPQINGELEKKGSSPTTSRAPCQVPTSFTVSTTGVAFLVVLLLFNPVPRLIEVQAQLVVFMASGLLVAGSRHTIHVLSNATLTYIGDISYVLYLVHWPIIQFWKYETAQKAFGFVVIFSDGVAILAASFALAVLMHHAVEKRLLRIQSISAVLSFILVLYVIGFSLRFAHLSAMNSNENEASAISPDSNFTLADVISAHEKLIFEEKDEKAWKKFAKGLSKKQKVSFNNNMKKHSIHWFNGRCKAGVVTRAIGGGDNGNTEQCILQGTGNKTMLLMGNSHAIYNIHPIEKIFSKDYSKLYVYTKNRCVPADGFIGPLTKGKCDHAFPETIKKAARVLKPDVTFLIFKFSEADTPFQGPLEQDPRTVGLQDTVSAVENSTKVLIISNPQLAFDYDSPNEIAKRLQQDLTMDNINLKLEDYRQTNHRRMQILDALKCEKCIRLDWSAAMCSNATQLCEAYDTLSQISYFNDDNHYSLFGTTKLLPLYVDIRRRLEENKVV